MSDEKFGIPLVLELLQSSVKKTVSDSKAAVKEVQKAVKSSVMDFSDFDFVKEEMKSVEEEIRKLQKENKYLKGGSLFEINQERIRELQDYLLELSEDGDTNSTENEKKTIWEQIKSTVDQVKTDTDNIKTSISQTNFNSRDLKKNLNDVVKNAKAFTLSLIGARSIWAFIRRSMSSYLGQTKELQDKLSAVYYAIGSMFAPILEKIVNWFVRLIGYVDYFAKKIGLAGINMTNFNKQAQKATLAMDEINNISSGSGKENPFDNLELDPKILSIIDGTTFHEIGAAIGVIGGGLMLLKGLGKIESLDQVGDFLKGSVGWSLSIIGICTTIGSIMDYLNDPSWQHFGEIISGIGLTILGIGTGFASWPAIIVGALTIGLGFIISKWDDIKAWWNEKKESLPQWVQDLGDSIVVVFDSIFETIKNLFDKLVEHIKKGDLLSAMLGGIKNGIKNLGDWIGSNVNSIGDIFRMITNGINSFDVGTNYVPNDQLAMVHKGEAIIPAKYNNQDLYGNVSAEQLNLLSGIYEMVENINRKDFDISMDGQSVASKIRTINDINTQRNGTNAYAIAR